jgi:hypothetical protein
MCAVVTVIFGVCNLVRLLQLFVVMFCKCSVNSITNPNPVGGHIQTHDNIKQKILTFFITVVVVVHAEKRGTY